MFITALFSVILVLISVYIYGEIKNTKVRNDILKLAKKLKENELNRIKERQKYVNVILDLEKDEHKWL